MHFACYFKEHSKYSSSDKSLVMYSEFFRITVTGFKWINISWKIIKNIGTSCVSLKLNPLYLVYQFKLALFCF